MRYFLLCFILFITSAPGVSAACQPPDCVAFPKDAGELNVRDFGAKGDGITDDTAAINATIAASGGDTGPAFWQDRIVYFPSGTYLVSAPVVKRYADGRFGSGMILIGQARESTVIRLKDHAEGYDNSAAPKAIVFTSSKLLDGTPTTGGKDYIRKGEGNDAYMNFVENMTIDAGAGNPGAIGIDYLANNMGAVRHVRVHAGDGSGAVGIALNRKWPGPALLQDVVVEGFDTGIDVDNTEYGVTLESVHLAGQHQTGLRNKHNMVSAHDLTISDATLPIANLASDGMILIDSGKITGSASHSAAIENAGYLNLHGLTVSSYKTVFSDGVYAQNTLIARHPAWELPVENPPPPAADAPEKWVNVGAYGAKPDTQADSTLAIRKAFASGASTVYFPHGRYFISDNIVVPGSVRHIVGMTSTLHPYPNRPASFRREQGMLRAMNNAAPLIIEKLAFDNSYLGDQVGVEAAGSRPVILRDVVGAGVITLLRPETGGKVFVEDTCCGTFSIAGKSGVWVRQLNTEGPGTRIRNSGAPLWILGIKTEQDCTVLENAHDATTEILGGLLYITGTKADLAIAAFRNTHSRILLSYLEEAFDPRGTYAVHLTDTQDGQTKTILANSLPKRAIGRAVPQIVAP